MIGKIIMNLAISLDGYIADENGGFDWITGQGEPLPCTKEQYNFAEFLEGMDIVVMGKKCYDQGFAKEHSQRIVYVATNSQKENEGNIHFICNDIVEIIEKEKEAGKNIYLFGGGVLVDCFLKKNSIDEFIVGVIPTILGKGIPLFLGNNKKIPLKLIKYYVNDGVLVSHYVKR